MSFKAFIYYCAICGAWAAFVAWAFACAVGALVKDPRTLHDSTNFITHDIAASAILKTGMIGCLLGLLVAGGIGAVDAKLNAVGFQRVVRVLVSMAVGLLGGLLGGLIAGVLPLMLMVIGWMLVGVAVGASIGVYDLLRALMGKQDVRTAVKKTVNGVYGGLLGGLIGGIPFGLFLWAGFDPDESSLHSALTIGLVILGACIGLLIGLAQVFLKEAWLKVESGFRAGREVMLSKNETTIGRAEGCDIGLFGDGAVEKQHARIHLKNNQYFLADLETPGGTFVNDKPVRKLTPLRDGDAIRVGNSVLRFGERAKR